MTNWVYSYSSVIGQGHVKTGLPCQDSSSVSESADGKWLAIVVSDGAGSAKHSQISSNFVTEFFSKSLISLSEELEKREPGAWINDYVVESILKARYELRAIAKSDNLRDYHCTLLACLIGETGGFLIHIGDGAAFGGKSISANIKADYFSSLPENGEYSNETFFITEADWIKRLRITPINSLDWIMLGTDGGTSLSMVNDSEPKWGFVAPLFNMIKKEKSQTGRNNKLKSILADVQADKLTGDDKTICLAFRKGVHIDESEDRSIVEQPKKIEHVDTDKKDLKVDVALGKQPIVAKVKWTCLLGRFAKYTFFIVLGVVVLYLIRLGYLSFKGFFN